jgi:XTP/dITP diphosphohydrolase
MKVVFATRNKGKLKEIKAMLDNMDLVLLSLRDYPEVPDVIEDGRTFFENALKKAKFISEFTGEITLADDSGLEVDCLKGRPGIYSSRYSDPHANDERNIQKILNELKDVSEENRGASFRCVLVLYWPNGYHESFEGSWRGRISRNPVGSGGFGYDPIFFLPEREVTVAQLSTNEKNQLSHRAQAFKKLKVRLAQIQNS